MTNPGTGHGSGADGWEPLPQGDYDSDATAFVQLPPDGFPDEAPLAAPGHGYVPPQITVSPATGAAATDPAATGVWVLPQELTGAGESSDPAGAPSGGASGDPSGGAAGGAGVSWPDANQQQYGAPAQGSTGQWSIPLAGGELPDESGEFTTSALASQWGDRTPPPATLPGGAAAPWASEAWAQPAGPEPEAEPEPEPEPVVAEVPEVEAELEPEAVRAEEPVEADADAPSDTDVEAGSEPGTAVSDLDADGETADDTETDDAPARLPLHDDHPLVSYVLRVNGADRPVTDAWIGESLLYVLRERLGLAGAKDGCSQGECGACNVQVDGRLVASCLVPAATAAGSEVRTVEGLAADGQPSDVQRALAACGAVQCGFCVPGMAMTVHDLLEGNPNPTDLEARQALCGNLCRCSGYRGVLDAVRQVTVERQTSAEAAAAEPPPGPGAEEPRIPHQAGPAPSEGIQDFHGDHGDHGGQGTYGDRGDHDAHGSHGPHGTYGDFKDGGQA
ncbi:2Fe-2S iron-sulfur cluster-binding protein [Streptomyces longispororuber]|uniref:2Fe-2S iron-sulfur cluster-binding protein n=1 Tax=Streptomyces longispororuber TaxID=68230 RepID=UPI00210CC021|nr:2Fe-2S iron-sulfur cluster-binding protein [Streptomyces longispororuber]MCQ4210997.1 2Fe-2S iron-sulfur cluster-binding protein [Streptomyces longispororuber]